jgi:putative membrane protein
MIRPLHFTLSASALLALGACGQTAEAPVANVETPALENSAEAPALEPISGQAFANKAASSDAFEIATSKLAADKSKAPAIQSFAKEMVAAHTDSTVKLKAAASSATPAITPDPMLSPEQQAKLSTLQAKSGAEFDTAYAAEQVTAHQMMLDALRDYAATGDVPELKAFATGLTPIVAHHLDMAKKLNP